MCNRRSRSETTDFGGTAYLVMGLETLSKFKGKKSVGVGGYHDRSVRKLGAEKTMISESLAVPYRVFHTRDTDGRKLYGYLIEVLTLKINLMCI
jgi:hypothetical protein